MGGSDSPVSLLSGHSLVAKALLGIDSDRQFLGPDAAP